ncbi:MAG: hypothetical protein K2N87_13625 [Eubacterium sp.]|nr:hypothetical protein [Eubacterium sp.]
MSYITWDYYDICCNKRRCRILVPKEISQFWTICYNSGDLFQVDIDIIGNRKGLEAFRNACAVLANEENMIVYFPCKKNPVNPMFDYFHPEGTIWRWYGNFYFTEFVLMKPNMVKISDWKEIRKRIRSSESGQWGCHFPHEFCDMHNDKKYRYRNIRLNVVYRLDTEFFNLPYFGYSELACDMEEFLNHDLEKMFREDIKERERFRGEDILCMEAKRPGFELGLVFWDNDIYQETTRQADRNRK